MRDGRLGRNGQQGAGDECGERGHFFIHFPCSRFSFCSCFLSGPWPSVPGTSSRAGRPWSLGCDEEDAELVAHQALADVVVTVAVRAQGRLRVVHVQCLEAVEPDLFVHFLYDAVQLVSVGDVVARGVQVARVEADADARVAVEAVDERGELVDRAADRVARAGRVLDQQPGVVRAALEALLQCGHDAFQPLVEAGALVGADVEDHAFRADAAGDVDGVLKGRNGLVVEVFLRARQVDQVERVADDALDAGLGAALLEALEVRRGRGSSGARRAGFA